MKSFSKWLAILSTSILTTVTLMNTSVFAAGDNVVFLSRYEHNAQIEAELLQQVETIKNASDSSTASDVLIQGIVTELNAQISSLYTLEQAVDASLQKISTNSNSGNPRRLLQQDAQSIVAQINKFLNAIHNKKSTNHGVVEWLHERRSDLQSIQVELKNAKNVLSKVTLHVKSGKSHSSEVLTSLQTGIFMLQQATIQLTGDWFMMNQPSVEESKAMSVSGLAYNVSFITFSGSQRSVRDIVVEQPIIKDATGQILPATGTYQLIGASGSGVSIDSITGVIKVNKSASPGIYTIVYEQSDVSESITIQVF